MARRALVVLILKGCGFVWIQHTTHYSIAVGPADFPRYSLFAKGVPTMFQMHPLQFYVQIIRQFSTTHGPPARENSSIL